MPDTIYDVAIIGSGPGGYTAAIRAGQYGLKTALIEKDVRLGGTCLQVGCIPTKSLLFDAEIYDHFKAAKEHGIENVDGMKVNWGTIQDRKNKIVTKHTKGLEFLMRKNKVTVVPGYGRLTGPVKNGVLEVEVTGSDGKKNKLQAKNAIIATGSQARMLFGLKPDSTIVTNIEVLSLDTIPKSLIVIGSGAVGVEFASIYKSYGSDVTVIEALPRLVPVEDEEVSKELLRVYKRRGITCHLGAKVEKIEKTKTGASVSFTTSDGKPQQLEAEKVLIAVGRAPQTDDIGLDKTKVKADRGFILTNEWMQTDEPCIYAIGDIVLGTPQLAHVAFMQGMVAVAKIAGKYARPVKRNLIPGCTYCEPQIGSVGLTEAQAREKGYKVKIGKFPFTANSRATIISNHDGFVKVVSEEEHGEILGVHVIGPQATELISEAVTAMQLEATVEEMMFTIHAHPTLYEALFDGFGSVEGKAINI